MLLFPIRSNSGDEGKPTRLVVPEDRPVRPNFQKPCLRRQAAGSLRCCQPIAAPGTRARARTGRALFAVPVPNHATANVVRAEGARHAGSIRNQCCAANRAPPGPISPG